MNDDEKIWAEAIKWFASAGPNVRKLVQQRAAKKAPVDSILSVDDEGLPQTFLDEYADVLADEIRAAFIRRVTDDLIASGDIEVVEVLPSGERVMRRTV